MCVLTASLYREQAMVQRFSTRSKNRTEKKVAQISAVSDRLFASSEIPHTLEEADRLEPFLVTTKTSFLPPDVLQTELLHYFVGFVGDVGPTEDDVLWPNQVGKRVCVS